MMFKMSVIVWIFAVFLVWRGSMENPKAEFIMKEEFTEDLLLRPLPDGKVLSHFHFIHKLPQALSHGSHHSLFPKALFQLVKKFHIKEMELSFTQGRWNYQRWGGFDTVAAFNAKPVGVELWALFDVSKDQIDATWGNLTHALSGLFCASINFLESPTAVAEPSFSFKLGENWMEVNNRCNANTDRGKTSICEQNGHSKELQNAASLTYIRGGEVSKGVLSERSHLGQLRYGALPREAVCTENLTPWLKLLPCRDKAGLTTLLDRSTVYNGFYHSLRLNIKTGQLAEGGILLHQTLTLVLLPSHLKTTQRLKSASRHDPQVPNWSLFSIFGKKLASSCPLAKTSHVYLEFVGNLMEQLKELEKTNNPMEENVLEGPSQPLKIRHKVDGSVQNKFEVDPDFQMLTDRSIPEEFPADGEIQAQTSSSESDEKPFCGSSFDLDATFNRFVTLNSKPTRILREVQRTTLDYDPLRSSLLIEYELEMNKSFPFDFGLIWNIEKPLKWSPTRAPFRVSRYLLGSGNARGSIATVFKVNNAQNFKNAAGIHESNSGSMLGRILRKKDLANVKGLEKQDEGIDVIIFQIVPWYVRMYWHTLSVVLDGNTVPFWNVARVLRLVPAEDRTSPAVMELGIRIPSNISSLAFTIEFDKGFLKIDEHPPDANRGFDIPAAIVSFPGYYTQVQYEEAHGRTLGPIVPVFLETEEKPIPVYTEILLMQLATPDFSMPYNVITLTCTVLALYFDSLLNVLRRRIGEEERRLTKLGGSTNGQKLKRILAQYLGKKGDNIYSNLSSLKGSKFMRILIVVIVAVATNYALNSNK